MYKAGFFITLLILLFTACQNKPEKDNQAQIRQSKSVLPEVAVIKEAFTTLRDESDNVDSPAIWHGKNGQNWLLATAKEGNVSYCLRCRYG
jgi:3-phytase